MSVWSQDELFMAECIRLANLGKGYVSPNPLVGAVLVKNGRIIGRGCHRRFGGPHAEIDAIRSAGERVAGATLYVNLDPCSHFEGKKTPPCTDAIISHGIRRVVVGIVDPNPLVKGKGIRALKSAGVEVSVGALSQDCRNLNEFYFKRTTTGSPFVTLKIAQTLDGKIAQVGGLSKWITSKESRKYVHQLRAEYDAVLIGANTARLDNPHLTVRLVKGRNPKRVLLDGKLSTPISSKLFSDHHRTQTILFTRRDSNEEVVRKKLILERRGVQVIESRGDRDGSIDLKLVLKSLADQGVNSILVEGGQEVFTQFLNQGLVDKMIIFVAPKVYGCNAVPAFGELTSAGRSRLFKPSYLEAGKVGEDILLKFRVNK